MITAAERSLKRLRTPYIDLYLIHWPNLAVPLGETMKALDRLVEEGKIKHIGVSNFSVEQLREAQRHTAYHITANQIEYNLAVREKGHYAAGMGTEIVPYCQRNNLFVVAYRPLDKGRLAQPGMPLVGQLAEKYGRTPAQIALRWLLEQKNVVVIPKATVPAHLQENCGALGWKLEQEDIEKLDALPHQ